MRIRFAIVTLALALAIAAPSVAAPEKFVTDSASPLRRVGSGKGATTIVRFEGAVALSGGFLAAWETIGPKRSYLRVVFRPTVESAALLPHPVGAAAVADLILSNPEQATSMLLMPEAAQRILGKELLSAEGEARITIRDYRVAVECDHRWYMARLISVVQIREVTAELRGGTHLGC